MCCRVDGCICVYALVCLLVFLFVTRGHGSACVFSCVCARARLLRVALSGENEGLHIAWNSRAWFWKKGAPALFDVSPSSFMCCQSAGLHRPLHLSDGFDGQKYDGHKTVFTQQLKGSKHNSFSMCACVHACACVCPCVSWCCVLCVCLFESGSVSSCLRVHSHPLVPLLAATTAP